MSFVLALFEASITFIHDGGTLTASSGRDRGLNPVLAFAIIEAGVQFAGDLTPQAWPTVDARIYS